MADERRITRRLAMAAIVLVASQAGTAVADEGGVSFWLPGQYASFAAVPGDPGWSLTTTFYHESTRASRSVAFNRGGGIQAGVRSRSNLLMIDVAYAFATPVLAGQLSLGLSGLVGTNAISAKATLTAPGGGALSGKRQDSLFGIGDLYPTASLRWSAGRHNLMVYATGGIPVGSYDADRLAATGLGHWALDMGGGYTWWNEETGIELSAVLGFTYNFLNPSTHYRSGIDGHLDWGVSWSVTKDVYVGAAGYVYQQLGADSGRGATRGAFRSRVMAIGPQLGATVTVAGKELDLEVRGYREFAARNRLEGWTAWVAVSAGF